ncbi:hypothetical protein [Cellulomonas chengniuliangii]|uniref:hypothetical protein n=1 Tax=Cellulomonas chengniuliangii TaxID=2968084 RepID=UPI001D0EE74B|nr:hypothetical protein [Cellulomonas chengniuliangii]MCC2318796.1 hypothetical protein [Cellulomonas chengniuliangii]
MAQAEQQLTKVARALLRATESGKIKWRPGDGTVFQYSAGDSSAVIRSRDEDGVQPYVFELFDDQGVAVESLMTRWFNTPDAPWEEGGEPADWNETLEDLYHAARRNALNIDRVIGSLLKSLNADEGDDPPF